MRRADEILDLTLDQTNPNFNRVLTSLTSAISSIFNTQAKVDETMLRAKQANKFEEMLNLVREERERLRLSEGARPLDGSASEVSPPRPN